MSSNKRTPDGVLVIFEGGPNGRMTLGLGFVLSYPLLSQGRLGPLRQGDQEAPEHTPYVLWRLFRAFSHIEH